MICKNCGQEINENIKFCPKCGTQIEMEENNSDENMIPETSPEGREKFCPNCGKEIDDHSKFCGHCGYALGETPQTGQKRTPFIDQQSNEQIIRSPGFSINFTGSGQLTGAFVAEVGGLFMWLLIWLLAPENEYFAEAYYDSAKAGVPALIGYGLEIVALVLFHKHEKRETLHGIGLFGKIVAAIIVYAPLVLFLLSLLLMLISVANK